MIHFDTDYMAGAHPRIMRRLMDTNMEETVGYGGDEYTARAVALIREACGCPDALVQLLVGGTQTNATVIDGLLHRHEGVLAAESAHINVHESGAIEHSGHKVLVLSASAGKLRAEDVDKYITDFYRDETYEHMVAPGMLYISQPTEFGTLYSLTELTELSEVCRKHHIPLYIDGARLGYALASPEADFTLKDIAHLADVFYIGGTKVGAMFGEAVVAADPSVLPHFFPLVKQHGALLAKGRLLGLQFETLFSGDMYQEIAGEAVRLALKLRDAFARKGYYMPIKSATNQQFVVLPNEEMERLMRYASFEMWGPKGERETLVRFVTSWATTEADVDVFIRILEK